MVPTAVSILPAASSSILLYPSYPDHGAPLTGSPAAVVQPAATCSPSAASIPVHGFTPQQIRAAYGIDQIMFGSIVGDGSGQTIAIVDAYDHPGLLNSSDPNFATSDLAMFDKQFGLPDPPSFTKLDQSAGRTTRHRP